MIRRTIKYPYAELLESEIEKVQKFKDSHNLTDDDIYVSYIVDTPDIGYKYYVSMSKPQVKNGQFDFGLYSENITDIDARMGTF